jgi:uncharacterized protein YkwD
MKVSNRISQLGVIIALATLAACGGGGSTGDSVPGQANGGQSSGGNTAGPNNPNPVPASFSEELVTLVNAVRAQARTCGSVAMPAAGPIVWNDTLETAAFGHSSYMQQSETFSHTGSGGSSVGDRATDAGYDWQTVGENIAAGYPTASAVMDGWVNSAGHCENLMAAAFTEMGVSKVEGVSSNIYSDYWTMVLAAPR